MGSSGEQTGGRLEHPERIFVVSGPSGVGKNTIVDALCAAGRAVRAVTATSRAPRPGEVDGKDYYFKSAEDFERWLGEGFLLGHTRYCGHYYGTPASSANRACRGGLPVLLVIDVDGAFQLKGRWPQVTLIFISPPTGQALQERLSRRGDTGGQSAQERLDRARAELAVADRYDRIVVNDRLDRAVQEVAGILEEAAPNS